MSLTKLEKVGMALAFIPGVSTVVGIIQGVVYRKRSKEHEVMAKQALEVEANTIDQIAQATLKARCFSSLSQVESRVYNNGIIEAFPLANLFVAGNNIQRFRDLSKIRDLVNSLENHPIGDFLLDRYGLEGEIDVDKTPILLEALERLFVQLDRTQIDYGNLIQENWYQYLPSLESELKSLAQDIFEAVQTDQEGKTAETIYTEQLNRLLSRLEQNNPGNKEKMLLEASKVPITAWKKTTVEQV